jgi:lipopolysaccharide export system ATP-binding protein
MTSKSRKRVLYTWGLKKSFGDRVVVNGVDLEIASGEVVGLLGPNGAGKTTTFYMVVGLSRPDSGQVLIGEEDITSFPMYLRARKGISYLPQEPSIFRRMTVRENLAAVLETRGLAGEELNLLADRLLADLKITHIAHVRGYALSGGERRRAEIARALATEPDFILLDEPFAGIDPLAVLDIQNIIGDLKARGIGILISDHNVRETLGVCDRAYILNEGVVLEHGDPLEIAESRTAREIYLGDNFSL